MTFVSFTTRYLTMNILVVVGFGFSAAVFMLNQRFSFIKSHYELRFNYFLIAAVVVLSTAQTLLPKEEFFRPPAKVWSASTASGFDQEFSSVAQQGYLSIELLKPRPFIKTDTVSHIFWLITLVVLLTGVCRLAKDVLSLLKLSKNSFLIRQIRRVRIVSSDLVQVPFSYRLGHGASVVIPSCFRMVNHFVTQTAIAEFRRPR